MLRSTYKPSAAAAAAAAPLLPGWTEHTAPTGHKYYYHAETKQSTYQRPAAAAVAIGPEPPQDTHSPYSHLPSLADPRVANAYLAQLNAQNRPQNRGGPSGRGRGGHDGRPRPQPRDKPRRAEKIPNCEPWMLVYTKYSRRFAYNPVKNASYWRIPEKLTQGILELDKARIRARAFGDADGGSREGQTSGGREASKDVQTQHDYDSDEYEEVEVEADEADVEGDDTGAHADPDLEDQHASKRIRTGQEPQANDKEPDHPPGAEREIGYADEQQDASGGPLEFTEADIAAQLQAMGEEYGLEPGDYDDGNMEEWPEGTEGLAFSQEDAKHLFRDLLDDLHINPYSPWEKLLDDGKIINDPRYTALTTTRARKQCWDEWTRDKISHLRDVRAQQAKRDPKIAYLALLQEKATPKLYWAEFKRKHKKEDSMRDMKLSDKDREKAYREHIARLKMAPATLKSDLMALLKAQPLRDLHKTSSLESLPTQVITDLRFISLDPKTRDPLIEAYIQTLPPPPAAADGNEDAAEDAQERRKRREARDKRERALDERNRAVEEQRRRRERDLAASRARLREEERELDVAMRVGKRGLQSQLTSAPEDRT
ncbi:hypothetical protein E4U42_003209 [Claviceps africana]|uniref:WW domain-containing protein n=1 Tax=Claviceps africana TaxID=83212 RepID=A0A8K0JCH6_9HYPO|nr:hypothetical protein E4U42_003209 [Claviceps africana]